VKLASCAHPDGVILVTDAMCAMGLGDGKHTLGEMNVVVNGISATLEGETTLAGPFIKYTHNIHILFLY
jgi:N-acetylglucosamine-6-phosphate deacetylase